jgi:hypothetical protein
MPPPPLVASTDRRVFGLIFFPNFLVPREAELTGDFESNLGSQVEKMGAADAGVNRPEI